MTNWNQYFEFEKKHKEDPDKTREFFIYIRDNFLDIIKQKRFSSVLEIGIGQAGGYIGILNNYEKAISIDPLWGDIKTKIEDFESEPESYDLIIISNALEHFDDLEKASEKIQFLLKRGGMVFIQSYLTKEVLPNHPHFFSEYQQIIKLFPNLRVEKVFDNIKVGKRSNFCLLFLKR